MKNEIIRLMYSVVSGSKYTEKYPKADFEIYDLESLEEYDGPFIWCVGPYGTHLLKTEDEMFIKLLETSSMARYSWVQGSSGLHWIPDQPDIEYWYYGGGLMFYKMDKKWCEKYLEAKRLTVESNFKLKGGKFPVDMKVPVNMESCSDYFKEQLDYANRIGDTSLQNCLDRFLNRPKRDDDHTINIRRDAYSERSFFFTEFYNGKIQLAGGIIYHGSPNDGYKQNGSVQMNPSYGWQIHT